jgi:ABC-2 type transport system ATP-binding protein
MDEPTRSLDPAGARELRRFIRQTLVEKLGRTVLLVTHNLEEAETLCDRVAIMDRGRIVACGPVTEIKRRIPVRSRYHLRVQHLRPHDLDSLKAIPGVVQAAWDAGVLHCVELDLVLSDENEALPLVMRFIVANGGQVQHCHAQLLSLEEAFVFLTRGEQDGA